MSLEIAQSFAWNLATSLMVGVILFRSTEGYGCFPPPNMTAIRPRLSPNTTRSDPIICLSATAAEPIAGSGATALLL